MSRFWRIGLVVAWAAVVCGCETSPEGLASRERFGEAFGELKVDASQEATRSALGEPHEVSSWIVTVPMWGPGESLASSLPNGTPIEGWKYVVGPRQYWALFDAREEGKRLVAKESYPEGAAF